MNQQNARVIDLGEVRRRREEEQRRKAQGAPVVLVWYPVFFWIPFWTTT